MNMVSVDVSSVVQNLAATHIGKCCNVDSLKLSVVVPRLVWSSDADGQDDSQAVTLPRIVFAVVGAACIAHFFLTDTFRIR